MLNFIVFDILSALTLAINYMNYLLLTPFLLLFSLHAEDTDPLEIETNIIIAPYYGEDQDIVMRGIMEARAVLKKEDFYTKIEDYTNRETKKMTFPIQLSIPRKLRLQ